MNTRQLLLVSTVGLAVNLFGMFAMGGHHHHVSARCSILFRLADKYKNRVTRIHMGVTTTLTVVILGARDMPMTMRNIVIRMETRLDILIMVIPMVNPQRDILITVTLTMTTTLYVPC